MIWTPLLILRTIGEVLLAAAVAFGIWWFIHNKDKIDKLESMNQAQGQVIEGTAGTIQALNPQIEAGTTQFQDVQVRRSTKDRAYKEVITHDQTAATWAATRIPDSVRNSDNPTPGD